MVHKLANMDGDRKLCFNLSGEYVCKDREHARNVAEMLGRVDVLFGNRGEVQAFVQV